MAFLADKLSHSVEVKLDAKVLAFTAIISVVAGILAGVLPALRLSRGNVSQSLKQGLGRTDADSSGHGTRSILVVLEVGVVLMLVVGGGVMMRSFQRLHAVNPGFDSHNVLTMSAMVSRAKFPEPPQQAGFFRQVLQRVRRLPGVESAGVIDDVPLDNGGSHQPVAIEGRPILPMSEQPDVDVRLSTPGYMSALRIPILRGRDFSDTDLAGRPAGGLIRGTLARPFLARGSAFGEGVPFYFFSGDGGGVGGAGGRFSRGGADPT